MDIVVTGAGRGIGLELVRQLIQSAEHRVWACSRDVSALKSITSPQLFAEELDITNASAEEIRQRVSNHFPALDVLIHNAGVLINQPFETTTLDNWRQTFDVNLFSVVKINQALLPLLKKSASAHIVHIGSMGGVQGASKFPGLSAYSASKAALANLTECMAEELKADGIHVNCLALGAVDTEMLRQAFPNYSADMKSTQMAAFIADFCLNQRPFFNGKILPVASSTP
jgi:3-oxoacyl-[acyl-carrier protein] reductase